jgi:K+-transporting ATPase c subunit
MEQVTESAGITVFREHYKQLGSPLVCAEFDADNFDRVTAKVQDWVASQSTKRNASTTNPSPRRRWNAQSRTCRHTKLATLLTLSELIKAGGSALVKLLLKLVNWVWNWTLPTAWSQG